MARRFHDLQASFGQPPEVHEVLRHMTAMTRRTAYLGRFVSGRILITDTVEGPESPYLEDLEQGQFRDGVSCVGALVTREAADPWAVVASTRAAAIPAGVVRHTMRAAEDLAPAL